MRYGKGMSHASHEQGVRLRRQIRAQLRLGNETVTLSAAEAELLVEEVGRLQQANDRLRRQNKKRRKRLQGAGLDDSDAADVDGDDVDAPSAETDADV